MSTPPTNESGLELGFKSFGNAFEDLLDELANEEIDTAGFMAEVAKLVALHERGAVHA